MSSSSSSDDDDWGTGEGGATSSTLTKLTDVRGHEMTDEMWEREAKQKELAIGIYGKCTVVCSSLSSLRPLYLPTLFSATAVAAISATAVATTETAALSASSSARKSAEPVLQPLQDIPRATPPQQRHLGDCCLVAYPVHVQSARAAGPPSFTLRRTHTCCVILCPLLLFSPPPHLHTRQ